MTKYEKIKMIADMQTSYKNAVRNKELTKKRMCEICVPVRDALHLSDLEILKIAREETTLSEIISLLENGERDVPEIMAINVFKNNQDELVVLDKPMYFKLVDRAEAQYRSSIGEVVYAIMDGSNDWCEEVCIADAIDHINLGGYCGIQITKLTDFLAKKEIGVLEKIAMLSGMDVWFSIIEQNGSVKIFDIEENKILRVKDGLATFGEGMAKLATYNLTNDEISILNSLFSRFEITDLLEDLR